MIEFFEALAFKIRELILIFCRLGFTFQNFALNILLNCKPNALNMSLMISIHVLPQIDELITVGSD